MRGSKRILVASLLTLSSAASGALVGFVLGLVGEALDVADDVPRWAVVVAAALVVVLDAFVPPLSVRRQVPQLWGRIFDVRTTAVLYGLRLGVGALTILRTWWWWFAAVVAALAGVWPSVLVGALFGAARILVMLGVGTRAGAMRRSERTATAGGFLALALIAIAAFAVPVEAARDATTSSSTARARPSAGDARGDDRPTSSSTTLPAPAPTVAADPALAVALPLDIGDGYERLPDDPGRALGALDLATAASIEQDEPAERALLETRRFQIGHARAWRHPDGRVAYAAVYRFATAGDAAAYLVDGFITLESRGARVYDLESPAGARGFSQASTEAQASEVAHGAGFTRANVFVLVVETSGDSAASSAGVRRIAQLVEMSVAASA